MRKRIAEQERQAAAAEAAAPLSGPEIAKLQQQIASILLPRETVTAGLKRLGAAGGSRAKPGMRRKGGPPVQAKQEEAGGVDSKAAKEQFDALTEAASMLMDSGELDVYSLHKVLCCVCHTRACSATPASLCNQQVNICCINP